MSTSWHIPKLPSHSVPGPDSGLHVIFLQRLPSDTRTEILQDLKNDNVEWIKELDPNISARTTISLPWYRDWFPSSDVIVKILSSNKTREHVYTSFVLVDSGWEAASVIVARWEGEDEGLEGEGGKRLVAARVPLEEANLLLTLCDRGGRSGLVQALGEERYVECKVDFYADAKREVPPLMVRERFERPSEWPNGLALSKERPVVISLIDLTEEERNEAHDELAAVFDGTLEIYTYKQPIQWRQTLVEMYLWLSGNSAEADDRLPALIIDRPVTDGCVHFQFFGIKYGEPRGDQTQGNTILNLIPLQPEELAATWPLLQGDTGYLEDQEHFDIWRQEYLLDMRVPVQLDLQCLPVFLLAPYTATQQHSIRRILGTLSSIEEGEDWGKQFAFIDYLWPLDSNDPSTIPSSAHSIRDLITLFQQLDPYSPSFSPAASTHVRITGYPSHFIAIDDRIFDEKDPKVILASSLDLSDDETYETLGWTTGTVPASEAYCDWTNLDIANVGPEELMGEGEAEDVFMGDLKTYLEEDWVDPADR